MVAMPWPDHIIPPPRGTSLRSLLPALSSGLRDARHTLFQFLWYKPPVGIVGVWSVLRIAEGMRRAVRPPPPRAQGRRPSRTPRGGSGEVSPPASAAAARPGTRRSEGATPVVGGGGRQRRGGYYRATRQGHSLDLDVGNRHYLDYGGIETVRARACRGGLRSARAIVIR